MSKNIVIIIGILILIIISSSYFIMKNTQTTTPTGASNEDAGQAITLKPTEIATVDDLIITHKGGGHKILMDGGDLQYAVFELKIKGTDKVEEFSTAAIRDTNQMSWNGYLIKIEKIVGDGDLVTLSVTKE